MSTTITHTCKSKFCSKCAAKTAETAFNCCFGNDILLQASSCCFYYRWRIAIFFERYHSLLDFLFIASRNIINAVGNDDKYRKNKRKKNTRTSKSPYFYKDTTNNVVFGAISTFHTFGISLDFNFHIHMLVCEKTNLKTNDINDFSYMNFAKLRKPRCFRFLSSWKKKFIPIKNSWESRINFIQHTKMVFTFIICFLQIVT